MSRIAEIYESVFKISRGSGGPARVLPMDITLDSSKNPVRVKTRRYPMNQGSFSNYYLSQLTSLGLIKSESTVPWQAAPHLVPKDSHAKFRTNIDLRFINAATIFEQLPMPIMRPSYTISKGFGALHLLMYEQDIRNVHFIRTHTMHVEL